MILLTHEPVSHGALDQNCGLLFIDDMVTKVFVLWFFEIVAKKCRMEHFRRTFNIKFLPLEKPSSDNSLDFLNLDYVFFALYVILFLDFLTILLVSHLNWDRVPPSLISLLDSKSLAESWRFWVVSITCFNSIFERNISQNTLGNPIVVIFQSNIKRLVLFQIYIIWATILIIFDITKLEGRFAVSD